MRFDSLLETIIMDSSDEEMYDVDDSFDDEDLENTKPKAVGGKSKTVEEIYQKKTQLEHILARPDTYSKYLPS